MQNKDKKRVSLVTARKTQVNKKYFNNLIISQIGGK